MIVRPDLWGDTIRVRFSNVFGKEALHLGPASVGLQEYSANVIIYSEIVILQQRSVPMFY
jgi:hypothetical protein